MLSRMHQAQKALHQAQQGSHRQAGALPRGLLVLPYLSIVAEKTAHLSLLLEGMKWRVTGYKGEEQGTPLAGKVRSRHAPPAAAAAAASPTAAAVLACAYAQACAVCLTAPLLS